MMCLALGSACAEALTPELIKKIEDVYATIEIQNVMGRYVMTDTGDKFAESVLQLFDLDDPDVCITVNGRENKGAEAVTAYWEMLESLQNANGGLLGTHQLTSPVIVISEDGMSAEGMWQDNGATLFGPGMGVETGDPEHVYQAMQEASRYSATFSKTEDGWRIKTLEWQILWQYAGREVDERTGWISDTGAPVFTPPFMEIK